MSPYEEAKAVYSREFCPRTFQEDLELHLQYGYVFSTDTEFIMARPVLKGADPSLVVNPGFAFNSADCWFVYLFAGHPSSIIQYMPYPLPWIGFERKNVLRFWPLEKFNQRVAYERIKDGFVNQVSQRRVVTPT